MITAAAAPADIFGTGIVIVGRFDPTVLQPSELLKTGALTESDIADLRYEILAPEVVVLTLPWVRVVAEQDKMAFSSTMQSPAGEPVRDFALAVVDLVPDSARRFTGLGVNREQHFSSNNEGAWHDVGHRLVPKHEFWDGVLKKPGTRSVAVQGQRDDGAKGTVNVRIEPSIKIKPGIYVYINDHFDADAETLDKDPEHLLKHLTDGWPIIVRRADAIVAKVKEFADVRS